MKPGPAFLFGVFALLHPLTAARTPAYGNFPIAFEPDASRAAYIARGDGYEIRVAPQSADLHLRNAANISMKISGGRAAALEPLDVLPGAVSHFRGADPSGWRTGIPTYSKVIARGVYPGIDMLYRGNQSHLEYDFIVAPGADPARIRLSFGGVTSLRPDAEGNLILATAAGDITQRKPVVYQEVGGARREIPARFLIAKGEVSFSLGAYDHSVPLIIDPVLTYASFIGGNRTDEGHAIAIDSAGNAYVAGLTTSTSRGDADALVRKINPSGTAFLYTATFGGGGTDEANAIAVDSSGNIFIAGRTDSSDFPNPAGAFQRGNAGGYDAFLLRVNPGNGQIVFSTYYGGSGDDRALALALDPAGNAYITGSTTSTDLLTNTAAFQTRNAGGVDGFVARFDPAGRASFATYFGGANDDRGYGIAADAAGVVYIAGSTDSDNFPLTGAFQGARRGNTDAFVLKFDPTGSTLLFSTYLGGGDRDIAQAIALDSAGSIYVTGSTASGDFPITRGTYQTGNAGGDNDIFVTKLSPDGRTAAYSTYIGSHGSDLAYGIAVDNLGQAYVTGSTDSDQFPVTSDATQKNRAGAIDAVVCKLNSIGTSLLYASFLGGGSDDVGRAVAVDSLGSVYLTGITSSSNFPVTGQTLQNGSGGGASDAFVAKVSFPTTPPAVNPGGVVNGADFVPGPVAAGSIISIFGNNFASNAVSAPNAPLPNSLGGLTVSINGAAVPIVYAGTTQINAQVPYSVSPGTATLVVGGPGGNSASTSFTVVQAKPAIFTGNNRGLIQNQDFSVNSSSNPARIGTVIQVYFTGQGPLDRSVPTGSAAPLSPLSRVTLPASATVGGLNAPIQFMGLTPSYVGLAQANIVVPQLAAGDYPVVLTIGGVASNPATVSIAGN